MKYKRLFGVLLLALVVSCLLALIAETLQADGSHLRTKTGSLVFVVSLATLPGGFVAMILKGMCNTHTPTGIAVAILVNTIFYFVLLLVLASSVEMRLRK